MATFSDLKSGLETAFDSEELKELKLLYRSNRRPYKFLRRYK